MSEHVALFVDRIVTSTAGNGDPPFSIAVGKASLAAKKGPLTFAKQLSRQNSSSSTHGKDEDKLHRTGSKMFDPTSNEDVSEPLLAEIVAAGECRICQEEDDVLNLEAPCACTGSLKYAHRKCVQHWCNEKGDTICEICCKPYEGGYTVPLSSARADSISINIGSWEVGSEQQLNSQRSRLFSVASEHVFLESDYEDYTRANARSAACFRSVAFILMVLLLLRHLLSMTSSVAGEDASTFIMLFFLRAVGFFLPCYVMARALNVLHSRRQREEAALAAAEVAYLLQNGQTHIVPGAVASVD